VLIAYAVIAASPSRWRWTILLHLAATVFVVVVTGNHFWYDGVAAAVLVGLAILIQAGLARLMAKFSWSRSREAEEGVVVGRRRAPAYVEQSSRLPG
jgi:hypothetical protein